eukprot:764091-Hanusia_phi.AAC.17
MARTRRSAWKLLRTADNPAVTCFIQTAFELANSADQDGKSQMLRLFLLKPTTGKTHQIRVAMKCLSSPILGDAIYAGNAAKGVDVDLFTPVKREWLKLFDAQIVIPPWESEGEVFCSNRCDIPRPLRLNDLSCSSFQECFNRIVPPSLPLDHNIWFPEVKLLRSDPACLF